MNALPLPHLLTLLGIILAVGALGGYASNFLDPATGDVTRRQYSRGVILGILAAATVPLLLQMLSSDLVSPEAVQAAPHKYFVFGAYCVVVSLFADRFLRGIGDNVLKKLTDLETKVDAARENADAALENSSDTSGDTSGATTDGGDVSGENVDAPADGSTEVEAEESTETESFNLNKKEASAPPPKPRSAAPPPIAMQKMPRERVLDALRDRSQKTKTAAAVAVLAKVSDNEAARILPELENSGLAKTLKTADGKVFWKAV